MSWNWAQADWPNFSWDRTRLVRAEECFLVGGGIFLGTARHLGAEDTELIRIERLSSEAITTSEIEGDLLDRASVQSSIRRQLGVATDHRRIKPAEQGIAEMIVDLHRSFAAPLSHEKLFDWHRMLTNGRFDLKDIGCYRTHVDPMQVVSGAIHAPRIHFEAPPSTDVPSEMERFIGWFNRTAPASPARLPALTRAGIAHLYFESIHPFEDGNGRIGRAIAEMALAQGFGRPTLIALAATMLAKRRAYYNALEACGKRNEITSWLVWFAATTLEAQHATLHMAEFLIGKTRLLDRLVGQLNERQEKVLLRVLREGPEGFAGGLSARNYMSIAGVPTATATRDLSDMVTKGALVRTGARRHARYHLPISVGPPVSIEITADGDVLYAPSL